jgi:hypothetical protein
MKMGFLPLGGDPALAGEGVVIHWENKFNFYYF